MAALAKIMHAPRALNNVIKLLTNLSLKTEITNTVITSTNYTCCFLKQSAFLHTTPLRHGLMEFFEDEKNYGKKSIKTGRSWNLDELRIKSNEDLHKLWYILLKERNMLLTMEETSKRNFKLFPSPERIDKVEISMENIETIVRERNKAYHLLETGESGERPAIVARNAIGMPFCYRLRQYSVPKFMNTKWHKTHVHRFGGYAVKKFLKLLSEKHRVIRRKAKNRNAYHVMQILRNFPNVNMEAIKAKYPDVDIEKVKERRRCRGHFIPS